MDIKVGSIPALTGDRSSRHGESRFVEARVLAVRQPRKRRAPGPGGDERRKRQGEPDPDNGRVLVLMVKDRSMLPPDFDRRKYRVFLRFAPISS